MPLQIELTAAPGEERDLDILKKQAARQSGLSLAQIAHLEILKCSLDARSRYPIYRIRAELYTHTEEFVPEPALLPRFRPVDSGKKALIVGAGPGGYFAALEMIERGIKPIVLDRGKDARTRRRDIKAIQQMGIVNPDSNYCFGEGGAGAYSDGKLYTRSVKRGDVHKALKLLVEHGAKSDILIDAHPHIGSNKLPGVIQNIRATIEQFGGEVHFETLVTDLILRNQSVIGVVTTRGELLADAVVLATGHSARDIYTMLHHRGIRLESKPFALGVRVEHPQALVDALQYKQTPRQENLPAASYSLVCQVGEKGVFSFCMCPGGLIVPAATAPGEIVVNGMSMSRRDSPFANSGMVTTVDDDDLKAWAKHGLFAGLAFQQSVEQALFAAGDGSQKGPALRLTDFIKGKLSVDLPKSSYIPGLYPAPLYSLLPEFIYRRLKDGFLQFGKSMKTFITEEANVVATESRTSSPVRIPRQAETLMHPDIIGLFPCGEGAGYAGGIISAAMDGQNVAGAVSRFLTGN